MQLTRQQRASMNGTAAVREHLRRTGYTYAGQQLWSDGEIEALHRFYPDYRRLVEALPQRSRKAIEMKVAKLGLAKPRRIWTDGEVTTFRPPYQAGTAVTNILPLLDDKAARQLYGAAAHRRIRRPRRRPRIIGIPILDSIRQRAFDMNITLRDLDEATGQTKYFSAPRSLRWRAIARAIDVLAGTAVIRWPAE